MSAADNIYDRAVAGDLIAMRLLVLSHLEAWPPGAQVPAERIDAALTWARHARAAGDGEDALRLFSTLLLRLRYPDIANDDRATERAAGEAVAALICASLFDTVHGDAARRLVPEAVCAMRVGAVFHARLILRAWGVSTDRFETVLQSATSPDDGPAVEQMPSADLLASASACDMLARKVADRFDIECDAAIPLVANAPDALEKLKTPEGWQEIADGIGECLGSVAAPDMPVTVN